MKHNKDHNGMALITILLMMVILVMLTVTLITINSNNLLYTLNYNSRVSALMAAESGVAYAIYELQSDPNWCPAEISKKCSNGNFRIYFKPGTTVTDYYSVNNLNGEGLVSGYNEPNGVPPHTVNLIVTGQTGSTVRRIRVLLGRANISEGGRCSGTANVYADKFVIQRATTAKDTSQGGSFHSNYRNPSDPNETSISAYDMLKGSTQVNAYGGVVSACGGIDIRDSDVNTMGTQLRPKVEPKPIPDVDIKELVLSKSGKNPVSGGTYRLTQTTKGGQFQLMNESGVPVTIPYTYIDQDTGQLVFTKDVYFNSDVKFEFPMKDARYATAGVRLEKTGGVYPSLYVNGSNTDTNSFWVMGKVEGNGSIYNTGSTKFIMETDLVASEETGTELLSEGDINISLPASRISPINLSLTGAVLTHGNLNATVLDPNATDNPSVAMTGDKWPNDWVEKSYNTNVYGSGTEEITGAIEIPLSGPPPLNPSDTASWCMKIFPGTSIYANAKTMGNSNVTLKANGDGSFSMAGDAAGVEINFYKNGSLVTTGNNDLDFYTPCNFQYGSYPASWYPSNSDVYIDGVNYSSTSARNVLYPYMCDAINEMFGGSSSNIDLTGKELYAPDVKITGALIVTDPNNLDGTGLHNINAGNINVDLKGPQNKGDFTIVHSRNYEKLLASPEIRTKLVVNTWEELH
ncbi:MAG: hypothetical protein ABRQ39_00850 [Candidatus Eremiobacterota bacterium]